MLLRNALSWRRREIATLLACGLTLFMSSGSAKAVPLRGHVGSPNCPLTLGFGGLLRRCYTGRSVVYDDAAVLQVAFKWKARMDPCVVSPGVFGESYSFSAAPIWVINSDRTSIIEINFTKSRTLLQTVRQMYSTCYPCWSEPNSGFANHGAYLPDTWYQMYWSTTANRWQLWVNGTMFREFPVGLLGQAQVVEAGGETNDINNDMGVFSHRSVAVLLWGAGWYPWGGVSSGSVGWTEHKLGHGTPSGRYLSSFYAGSGSGATLAGSTLQILSDHHLTHQTDACGNTP